MFEGRIASITIAPGKTIRVIATIVGPVKRFVDMEVLVTEMDAIHCPIDSQVNSLLIYETQVDILRTHSKSELILGT